MINTSSTMFHWRMLSREPEYPLTVVDTDIETDVAVIGAGLTGLAAALRFARAGARVLLLDAGRIGQAASGRNNGQVIPHYGSHTPQDIEAQFGPHRGAIFNRMVGGAADGVARLVRDHDLACDFVQKGWIQACHATSSVARVRAVYDGWKERGYQAEWLDRGAMTDHIGSSVFYGGWKAGSGGYLNPYAFCQGMARAAGAAGVDIRQNSAVLDMERVDRRWLLTCPGGKVFAREVMVAANLPQSAFWPGIDKVSVPVRVYQVSTGRLEPDWQARILPGREGVSDTSRVICAFRYDSDGGLAMVGQHTLWHDAANRGRRAVAARLRRVFPGLPLQMADRYWEGTIAAVVDRLPRLMALAPGLNFAGIYSGRGVALSVAWGDMAAGLALGDVAERDAPVPVTRLRTVPFHAFGVQYARYMHPRLRAQDRREVAQSENRG
ncbi:MAG: FAD-binding oxidoreductase [Acetobacter sp.]|uniref:NAD(P)/FAD-dependent oxidoreductase n=1 Tax=Acetobacter sp. TaxID=440 RepID=UPI0039E8728C